MSVKHRADSIKELSKKKTAEELAEENVQLKGHVEQLEQENSNLSAQVTDTQLAIAEVYETFLGGVE